MSGTEYRVVIPARYASSRFPGKVLAPLGDLPLIGHVCRQALGSAAREVIVATDDERIAAAVTGFDVVVAMTRADHASGSDRIYEVAERSGWAADDIVVNLQGDAPLLAPECINQVAGLLAEWPAAGIATLCTPITDAAEFSDPNVVKVVADRAGRALYFSRASIPAAAHDTNEVAFWRNGMRHVGLYAYRVGALAELAAAGPCTLERSEKLEQLRAMWIGIEIRVATAACPLGPDVDTPDDLAAAEKYFANE